MTSYGTCWSDESRGLLTCPRIGITEVNDGGKAAFGCPACKTLTGFADRPASLGAPNAKRDGWRQIPAEFLR